jgi:hypothetical protein
MRAKGSFSTGGRFTLRAGVTVSADPRATLS